MKSFNFKKKYGQNFLKDINIQNKIVKSISPNLEDLIIEIGPGSGALTNHLINMNCLYMAYEIDLETKCFLSKLETSRTTIIYDDFLKRDLLKDLHDKKYQDLYIIGNLPYYIITPIIIKIIDSQIKVKEMVFMIQKEVAERFSAKPGTKDYGSISVFLNHYYRIEQLFTVGRKCFEPIPNVDSAVIKLISKGSELIDEKFNKLVRDAFQFKRKNIRNNLKNYDLNKIEAVLQSKGFSLSCRAEELSYEIFEEIAKCL